LANHQSRLAPDFLGTTLDKVRSGFDLGNVGKLPLWIGADTQSEQVLDLASDGPHLIIVGPTGSGKSEFLKLLVYSLLQEGTYQLVLFDFKGGATLERFPDSCIGLATDLDPASQKKLWEFIAAELSSREQQFAKAQVADGPIPNDAINLAGGYPFPRHDRPQRHKQYRRSSHRCDRSNDEAPFHGARICNCASTDTVLFAPGRKATLRTTKFCPSSSVNQASNAGARA
jgi:DNA segregation ATPase FtsK/SpoIIIE-like protein